MPDVRKGQAPPPLDRDAFRTRFAQSFVDPAFAVEKDAIARLETIAWHAYEKGRKAPLTHAAGPGEGLQPRLRGRRRFLWTGRWTGDPEPGGSQRPADRL